MLTAPEWEALRVSVVVAGAAVVVSLPLGIATGWFLARSQFRGKAAVETLINLPLVLPPVVTGYLLLVAFGRNGWIGGWLERALGVRIVFDWKGAALAAAVVSFPLMVRSIRLAFTAVDVRMEHAARTLGAGPWDTFFTVSLPLARNGVIAGSVLAFARSIGEFGATIMIAGSIAGRTRTVSLYVYHQLERPGGFEESARLVMASVVIAAGALVIGDYLERRGRKRLGLS